VGALRPDLAPIGVAIGLTQAQHAALNRYETAVTGLPHETSGTELPVCSFDATGQE